MEWWGRTEDRLQRTGKLRGRRAEVNRNSREPFDCAPFESLRVYDRVCDREHRARSREQEPEVGIQQASPLWRGLAASRSALSDSI